MLIIFYLYLFKSLSSLITCTINDADERRYVMVTTVDWIADMEPSWYPIGRAPTCESLITAFRFSQLDAVMDGKIKTLVY